MYGDLRVGKRILVHDDIAGVRRRIVTGRQDDRRVRVGDVFLLQNIGVPRLQASGRAA